MTTMQRIAFAVLSLGALSACGQILYSKPGGTTAQREIDQYECKGEWDQSANGREYARDPIQFAWYGFSARGEMQRCMELRGWKREK